MTTILSFLSIVILILCSAGLLISIFFSDKTWGVYARLAIMAASFLVSIVRLPLSIYLETYSMANFIAIPIFGLGFISSLAPVIRHRHFLKAKKKEFERHQEILNNLQKTLPKFIE